MTIFLTSAPLAPVPSILKAKIFVEFPSGPLGVGDAPVDEIAEIDTEHAANALGEHTLPNELGLVFDIAKPGIGIGSHYVLGDAEIDNAFKSMATTYDGPVMLAHDLSVINVTPEQIVIRQAKTSLLASVPNPPKLEGVDMKPGEPSDSKTPSWLVKTRIQK